MRRSFGARGGTSPNRGILKSFKRAVRAGVKGDKNLPHHSSIYKQSISLSTKPSSLPLFLSSASYRIPDDFEWVSINKISDNNNDDEFHSNDDDAVFGLAPSRDEVDKAVSALQLAVDPTHCSQFLEDNRTFSLENAEAYGNASPTRLVSRVSSFGSESDWIEPSLHLCYPMMLQRHGSVTVYDALHLLQTEPSIKRMVVSLSSDKAVWDAVLKNEMVRELRDSMSEVGNKEDRGDNNAGPERATNIFSWVYEKTKVKVIEMIEKIVELVNELFRLSEDEETEGSSTGKTEDMLQISFMLSIMVLIIVVVDRSYGA